MEKWTVLLSTSPWSLLVSPSFISFKGQLRTWWLKTAPRSPELFGKNSVWKVYNKSSLSLLHYPRRGLLLASLFLPLLLRFITSVSPNLGWWGGCCMTRHMSGPLREKAASLLLGLFSLRDHAPPPLSPPSPLSLLAPPSEEAPPLHPAQLPPTLLMPSLAGMWLVYLLWPAARVKGAFWPHLGRGHLRLEGWLWDAGVCACMCVSLWGVGWKDEWLKKLGAVHVRDNMWLVHLSLCHPCLVRGKYVPLLLLLRNGMHRQVTQSLLSRLLPSTESAREKGCRVIVTVYGDFAPSHWCIPLNAHANIPVSAHSLQPDSSIVFQERRGATGWDYRKLQSRVCKSLEKV